MSQDFFGYPTRSLANEHVRLDYLTTAGPRIVRLSPRPSHRPQQVYVS